MESVDHVRLPIVVRDATAGDVASMQAVDVAARQRFREIDDPRIARAADDPPYHAEGLTRAATEQRAWVAVDDLGAVIGFAVAWVLDGEGHLDELAVTPAHARRGVGRALVGMITTSNPSGTAGQPQSVGSASLRRKRDGRRGGSRFGLSS